MQTDLAIDFMTEADRSQPEIVPPGFAVIDSRDYGRTRIILVTREAASG